jgi:uncharacterized protein (TIGR02145 family)
VYGGGLYDCFIAKFNQAGDRLWGTYYGGSGDDNAGTVSTDNNKNVFLSGQTTSNTGIATPGSYQPNRYASTDAFLAKFDSNGVRQWGTYYGGESGDNNTACTNDGSGNVYFAGLTSSHTNIASPGAYQTIYGGGPLDAFLAKFNSDGQRLWATYYGGSGRDDGYGCNADSTGNIYVVGRTNSPDGIASPGCHQPDYGGGLYDSFIVKFDSSGQRLWGTHYGGTNDDEGNGCAIGSGNDIFMVGLTNSSNNISTPDSYQPVIGGNGDGMLVKFNAAGQRQWGTYYGGSADDVFENCSYVKDDTLCLAGYTLSTNNITSPGAWQEVYGGARDDMLIKFIECWPIDTAGPIAGPVNVCKPSTGVNYSISSLAHAVNYIWTLPPGITISSGAGTASINVDIGISAISGTIWVKGLNKCNDPGDSAYLFITVSPAPVPVIFGPNITCAGDGKVYTTAPGKTNYQWSISAGGVITSGGTTTDNTVTVTWNVVGTQHVYLNYTDANGCSADTPTDFVVQVTVSPAVDVTITPTANPVCAGTSVTFTAAPLNGGGIPSFQWKVNGVSVGTNSSTYTYNPLSGDQILCILTSNIACPIGNPATSNIVTMNIAASPVVTFIACFDTITTINAKPIKLKGGIPLGGTYSGPGVNSITGIFNPAAAGTGTHTITYTYTNAALCSALAHAHIINYPLSIVNCGSPITDIRDNKVYQTVQIGSQCWLASNLNYGTILASSQDQRDNCVTEKYCYKDNPINCTNNGGLYQWDELMQFDETPADQGFCPPGWHIPSENDWNILFANYINSGFAGSPLKYSGYSGFNALLSGAIHINKGWDFQGFATFFWSSTTLGSTKA